MNTSKLRKNINKFYKHYDLEHPFDTITITKDDMYDHNALMTAYESLWLTMEQYDNESAEYQWMTNLYGELGDYIDCFVNGKPKSKALTIFKLIISIFGTMGIGVFTVAILEYGCYLETVGGLVLAAMVATTAGIGVYEDIKEGM